MSSHRNKVKILDKKSIYRKRLMSETIYIHQETKEDSLNLQNDTESLHHVYLTMENLSKVFELGARCWRHPNVQKWRVLYLFCTSINVMRSLLKNFCLIELTVVFRFLWFSVSCDNYGGFSFYTSPRFYFSLTLYTILQLLHENLSIVRTLYNASKRSLPYISFLNGWNRGKVFCACSS